MLSSLNEAYEPLLQAHWEKKENPEHYNYLPTQYVHPAPRQHLLGFVGGNEVSRIKGNQTDLESDLRGIHIPNTFCPERQYKPHQDEIVRENTKVSLRIHVEKDILPLYQMFSYPAVVAPLPMKNEVCMKPEKY